MTSVTTTSTSSATASATPADQRGTGGAAATPSAYAPTSSATAAALAHLGPQLIEGDPPRCDCHFATWIAYGRVAIRPRRRPDD